MANTNKLQSIQERAQALSETASAAQATIATGVEDNSATATSVASSEDISTGTTVSTSTYKETTTVASAYANQSDRVKLIVAHLEDYVLRAAPGKVIATSELVSLQKQIISTCEQLVNLEDNAEFAICYRRLLTLAKENEDKAFSPSARYRSISQQTKGDAYLTNYLKFMDMTCAFAAPSARASLIQRWPLASSAAFAKAQYRERLISFIREISGR